MKAVAANLLKFLAKPQQFAIPIYQRTYDWRIGQCQQLWNDILLAANPAMTGGHFIGSIVYIQGNNLNASQISQLMVIDGQQRLTTLTLLLSALSKATESRPAQLEITRKKLENYYLFNSEEDGDERYKLLLTRSDRETLLRVVEGRDLQEKPSQRVVENFRFFESELKKPSTDLSQVYEGLCKLMIVDVVLERGIDNPQLIFESLNATGLNLSQADLIRNYLLMDLEPADQTRIYQDRWFPMEQYFGHSEYVERFDSFMRDFLTVRLGRIPTLRDIYTEFKAYMRTVPAENAVEDVTDDLYKFSKLYVRVALNKEPDLSLRQAFENINRLRVDVAFPFLVEVYEDYEQNLFDKQSFLRILQLTESYVFRRAICGVPTNSLNKTFAGLYDEIETDRYIESFEATLMLKDGYRRFPRDEEFVQALLVKDVYNFRNRNYLLERLENAGRKECVSVDGYTIEHIMPQNTDLRPEWQEALGSDWRHVHAKWLHTIGNLTLTGYNSEYSDRSFLAKRDMTGGFKDSPIRLNSGIGQLETWNQDSISARASKLATQASQIWVVPSLSDQVLSTYVMSAAVVEADDPRIEGHSGYLHGDLLLLFDELKRRILNLDSSVRLEVKKVYIAFKADTNFVDVVPQKKRLLLILNLPFEQIADPKGMCRDITGLGRWGIGNVEASLENASQLDDAMDLIRQAFHRQESLEDGSFLDIDHLVLN